MKKLPVFFFMLTSIILGAQNPQAHLDSIKVKKIFSEDCRTIDLSGLWTTTDSYFIFGYISDSFERVKIHYTSVKKSGSKSNSYNVTGKIKIQQDISPFKGQIIIAGAGARLTEGDEMYDGIEADTIAFGDYVGSYIFKIESSSKYNGTLTGVCTGRFYLDRFYKAQYDDIIEWEHYSNNNFQGKWISADKKKEVICNWGDYRVPQDKDIDWGVGHFVPNENYTKNGWQDYMKIDNNEEEYDKYMADKKQSRWWE